MEVYLEQQKVAADNLQGQLESNPDYQAEIAELRSRIFGPLDHGSREWQGNAVLRHYLNCAELLEVTIERESLSDSELLNDNLARAVCEAPVLVGETLKCLPGAFQIRLA